MMVKLIPFNRENVFARDEYRCMYCGYEFPPKLLTFDHVIPKHQGGKMTWTNIVTACFTCNSKKRNRTPEEASMELIKQPYQPKILDLPKIDIFSKYRN